MCIVGVKMTTATADPLAPGVDSVADRTALAGPTSHAPTAPSPTPDMQGRNRWGVAERVAVRAMQRRLARTIPGCSKLRQCGLPVPASVNGPGLLLVENGRPVGGQLVACMSPLRCGFCSPLQWQIAADKLAVWSLRHEASGGWILHSALTVPHRFSDDLAELSGGLFGAWSGRSSGDKVFRRALEAVDLVATVPVFQVTYSDRAGFHPHLHAAFFGRGPAARVDGFAEDVERMWRKRVEASGLGRPGRAGVYSELVTNSQGFVEYLDPDHERHPNNDCAHPDHPKCQLCRADDDSEADGGWGESWDSPGESDPWASMRVLSQVGLSGVNGHRGHQAVMAKYLSGLGRRRRIVSGFRQLSSAYGPADLSLVSPPSGGRRCWVHPRLAAQVELCRHGGSGSLLHDGLAVASDDPGAAASLWAAALGRRVVVGVHREDGSPVFSLADGRPAS